MFDVLTTGAVVAELERVALDGRIQRIGLVDQMTLAAEVYAHGRRRGLVASANGDDPQLHLTDAMPSVDPNLITPFGLQLRKYVRGAFLVGIAQPPLERLVRLSIAKRMPGHNGERGRRDPLAVEDETSGVTGVRPGDEEDLDEFDPEDIWSAPDVVRLDLIVEIMGRHSNIILVDESGTIMESVKRVTPQMSRVRPVLPRRPYVLPPIQDKPDPRQVTSAGIEQLLRNAKPGTAIPDLLVRGLRGVSPQIGREAAFRLAGDATATIDGIGVDEARELARVVHGLYEPLLTGAWEPSVYLRDGAVVAYAATPVTYLAAEPDIEEQPVGSISDAIAMALEGGAGETASPRAHAQRRARVIAAIDAAVARIDNRLHSFRAEHAKTADIEMLRTWGETIFAYMWQVSPRDSELVVDDMRIPLDPNLTASENAQEYFERYRKAQKAGDQLPERIEETEREREYLLQLRLQAEQSDGFAAIEAIRQEFEEHTGGRNLVGERNVQRGKPKVRRVAPIIDGDGNLIYIGRSGRENDQVTFDIGGPNDTWLHARGVPGSHVIVRWVRPDVESDENIETAAALAAYYSGSRANGTVEVDVAKRRDVRKIKGAGPGMVTYRNEYTIPVRPLSEADLKRVGRLQ